MATGEISQVPPPGLLPDPDLKCTGGFWVLAQHSLSPLSWPLCEWVTVQLSPPHTLFLAAPMGAIACIRLACFQPKFP